MRIRSVVLDIGETLISDRQFWADWADWIGAPEDVFLITLGAVVAQGRDNADALLLFRPGMDLTAEYAAREAAGRGERLGEADLYPDVRPSLAAMRDAGLWVGVAGNQTARAAELVRALALPVDAVATSGEWGVAKPSGEFFDRVASWAPGERDEILYVGDHPANDVAPAQAAGLRAAHLRRGPWGVLWADTPEAQGADLRISGLSQLEGLVSAQ